MPNVKTDLPIFNDPKPPSYESSANDSNPPSYESAARDSNFKMFEEVSFNENDAHLAQMQQKNELQKDQMALDKEIAAHRHFFYSLLRTKLQHDALEQLLIELMDALKRATHDVDLNNLAKEYLKKHSDASPELGEFLEIALGHKIQLMTTKTTATGDFDTELLKPLPNTITSSLPIVEAIQLSTLLSHSNITPSISAEELTDENEYSKNRTFHY